MHSVFVLTLLDDVLQSCPHDSIEDSLLYRGNECFLAGERHVGITVSLSQDVTICG